MLPLTRNSRREDHLLPHRRINLSRLLIDRTAQLGTFCTRPGARRSQLLSSGTLATAVILRRDGDLPQVPALAEVLADFKARRRGAVGAARHGRQSVSATPCYDRIRTRYGH